MNNFRLMSFDLDSFTLVKSKKERSKRVMDYVRGLDIDFCMLQGNSNLLYDFSTRLEGYDIIYDYYSSMFLLKPRLNTFDIFSSVDCSAVVTKLDDKNIAFCNVKKRKKESLGKLRDMLREYENIDYKILAGTLQTVNIDGFCNKYNLDNVCSELRSNHVLVSKGLDARVVDSPVMDSVEVQPMVVDITYKKVR